jgi:hypothetical protein
MTDSALFSPISEVLVLGSVGIVHHGIRPSAHLFTQINNLRYSKIGCSPNSADEGFFSDLFSVLRFLEQTLIVTMCPLCNFLESVNSKTSTL